jgi:small subunit ribosomal protein S9
MAEKKEAKTYYLGTGRRKTAVARVRICEGKGQIAINERPLENYFTEDKDRAAVMGPILVTELASRVDVIVRVHGGGITGQADAIKQGLARAIKTMFSPAAERRAVTMNHITMVRGYKAPQKTGAPAAPVPAEGTEDASTGMIKKLRDAKFLTRDSRMKERKKYGLRGARRGTQFSKR